MKEPNFFIIGVSKAGTTSIYYYLKQHPEIFMSPIKEPNFLVCKPSKSLNVFPGCGPGDVESTIWIDNLEDYLALFSGSRHEKVLGEASLSYMYSDSACGNIKKNYPNAKVLAVLRNPIERAYSHYLHLARDERERLTFEEALKAEKERIKRGWEFSWHYFNMGLYYRQLLPYFEMFGEENIKVVLYEELECSPRILMSSLYEYLGVCSDFVPNTSLHHNISGGVRLRFLNRFCTMPSLPKTMLKKIVPRDLGHTIKEKVMQINLKELEARISPEIKAHLICLYREDIEKLQELIYRDLSEWLKE